MLVHATCVLIDGVGLLLRGAPGAGKSDLALRLIFQHGATLTADDSCLLSLAEDRVWARAPDTIAGLIEVRGIGPVRLPWAAEAPIAAVIDLVAADQVERLPEPDVAVLIGRALPCFRLHAFDASAPIKARLIARLATIGRGADTVLQLTRSDLDGGSRDADSQ